MKPKLSIIVPVYKVESYLRKCVDSLLRQDLLPEAYEIILVDDGSPDHCGEICDDYAAKHSNVVALHRENGGLGAARNRGIGVVQGEYVQFVDSDDYLEPNVLGSLVQKMEADGLDVLRYNYRNVNERYETFEPNKVSKPFVDYRDLPCDGLTFLTERLGFGCYACQFIVKNDLLRDCSFKEGVYFEDTDWTPRLLLKANRVTSTNLLVYNYLQREGSITQSIDFSKKRKSLTDKLQLIDSMKAQSDNVPDKRWFEGMIAQLSISIIDDVSLTFYGERHLYLQDLKAKGVFPLSSYHATPSAKRKIIWANFSTALLCIALHFKNKK